jgi:uncharacterized RDD family membrane protein YckC
MLGTMDRASLHVASATGVDVALPLAGAGSRSYAFLVDWHIRLLLAVAYFAAAAGIMGSLPNLRSARGTALVLIYLPPVAIYLLYHPVLEVLMRGRTPGKRMAGVRLVTREGGTPSVGALLVRNAFRLIDSLPLFYIVGLVATLTTRERLRIGDLAAGTLLIHDGGSAVAALTALEGITRDSPHDPQLIDLAQDVLHRWPELAAGQRATLARSLLDRLGVEAHTVAALDDDALPAQIRLALRGREGR